MVRVVHKGTFTKKGKNHANKRAHRNDGEEISSCGHFIFTKSYVCSCVRHTATLGVELSSMREGYGSSLRSDESLKGSRCGMP